VFARTPRLPILQHIHLTSTCHVTSISDQDELEERVERLNKVTLKVMTSSLGLSKAEQLQKVLPHAATSTAAICRNLSIFGAKRCLHSFSLCVFPDLVAYH
jgi:hypothetical protein